MRSNWFKAELLAADGRLIHQSSLCMGKDGHAFEIACFGLFACGRACAGTGSTPFCPCFCLDTGRDGHRRCRGIELKIPAGELSIGSFVLEKNDLTECLSSQLETDTQLYKGGGPGHFSVFVNPSFSIGAAYSDTALSNGWKNSITIAVLEKGLNMHDYNRLSAGHIQPFSANSRHLSFPSH